MAPRDRASRFSYWYVGDSSDALYNGTGVGTYTDRPDNARYRDFEGPKPGVLGLTSWTIRETDLPAALYRVKNPPLPAGNPGSLQSCEHGLAAGSCVAAGPCSENKYKASALIADMVLSASVSQRPLPNTGGAGRGLGTVALLAFAASLALTIRRRHRPSV